MNIPNIPKRYVKNIGYLSAILIFLVVGGISAATIIPQITKPLAMKPSADLGAQVNFQDVVSAGGQWNLNVTLYENSKTAVHNVVVTVSTDFWGHMSKSMALVLPYSRYNLPFDCVIPQEVTLGSHKVNMTINSDESIPNNQTLTVNINPPFNISNLNESSD